MTSTSPIQPPTITPHIPGRTTDRLQALLPQLFNPSMTEGEAFLRMQLSEAITVAIPLNRIEETHLLPQTQITPMPNFGRSI
jgi:positive phototaxis protein PixI